MTPMGIGTEQGDGVLTIKLDRADPHLGGSLQTWLSYTGSFPI